MTNETQALRAGSRLQGGRYTIEKTLGEGGFGITYLAVQAGLNRHVAVKEFFMRQFCERDSTTSAVTVGSAGSRDLVATARGKFVKEAQTIAGLDNNHIIRIYDIFEENGTAYYVMEHIPGGSLADLVKRRGVLPEEEAVGYARQIADALGYIHGQNILHLDIKPSNILFRKDGEIVLIDFGVSKHYDEEGVETTESPVARSRGYAPIEQYQAGGIKQFAPSTDIYSLGAVLYYMLTGKRPPEATMLIGVSLTYPDHVSPAMRAVINKAMKPYRGDRYQCAADFKYALGSQRKDIDGGEETVIGKGDDETEIDRSPGTGDERHDPKPETRGKRFIGDHEYVDLGLSVMWATCNVGASKPEEYGDYFAWGETETKAEYTEENSSTYGKEIGDIGGKPEFDAARANWGSSWRLPTLAEFEELLNECNWYWTTVGGTERSGKTFNGVKGYEVISKKNGKLIFLPAAGYRNGTSLNDAGSDGDYWSSTPRGGNTQGAYNLLFRSGGHYWSWYRRYYGHSVRPVSE